MDMQNKIHIFERKKKDSIQIDQTVSLSACRIISCPNLKQLIMAISSQTVREVINLVHFNYLSTYIQYYLCSLCRGKNVQSEDPGQDVYTITDICRMQCCGHVKVQ